jgi:heme oxygenase (biliverdin-IX-beta and delta-forming)
LLAANMTAHGPARNRQKSAGETLTHLRTMTRPAHRALEEALGLLDTPLDLDGYRRLLARLYGFWIGWEPQISGLLQDAAMLAPRRRLHLVAADLAALGVPDDELAALPRCPLTPLHDAAEALGSLYVMEGSTLGGRLIQAHIQRCLGSVAFNCCAYFRGYGAETGVMWQAFLALLDAAPAADTRRIGNGAVATFERLGWWLTRQ